MIRENEHILDGVRTDAGRPAGRHWRDCSSTYCGRRFISRQDGDTFCSERCYRDMNPDYEPARRQYVNTGAVGVYVPPVTPLHKMAERRTDLD